MSPIKRRSRQGLIQCPGCKAHVKASEQLARDQCIFCGTRFDADPTATGRYGFLGRAASAGRSGLIAASLLGIGTMGACITGTNPTGDATTQDTSAPADTGISMDAPPVALYGMPADMIPGEDTATAEDAGPTDTGAVDAAPQALYGLPPD